MWIKPRIALPVFAARAPGLCSAKTSSLLSAQQLPSQSPACTVPRAPPPVVWDSVYALLELHDVPAGPFLQPISVLLNGSPALKPISYSTLFSIICRLDEGALHHLLQAIGRHVKQNKTSKQYIPSSLL